MEAVPNTFVEAHVKLPKMNKSQVSTIQIPTSPHITTAGKPKPDLRGMLHMQHDRVPSRKETKKDSGSLTCLSALGNRCSWERLAERQYQVLSLLDLGSEHATHGIFANILENGKRRSGIKRLIVSERSVPLLNAELDSPGDNRGDNLAPEHGSWRDFHVTVESTVSRNTFKIALETYCPSLKSAVNCIAVK